MTDFQNFQRVYRRGLLTEANRYARAVERQAKLNVSGLVLNVRTGKLFNAIRAFVQPTLGDRLRVVAEANVAGEDYPRIWEETGTKAHFVAPKRARALSWTVGGKRFFSMGHSIPAVAAKPYLRPAMEQELPEYRRRLAVVAVGPVDRLFTRVVNVSGRGRA